jgi:hypothetical protein
MTAPLAPAGPPLSPSGHMQLRNLKVAGFRGATVLAVQTDINDFCAGRAVTGPPAFAAGFLQDATYIGVQFLTVGGDIVAYLYYTD